MYIVESFLSIQGEGKFAGNLAIFIRFAGCNFNCLGFNVRKKINNKILRGCDTLQAVYTKEFKKTYQKFNAQSLFQRVLTLKQKFNPIIVITGGEPLIHHKKTEFIDFIRLLLQNNFEVHFESNGSIFIDFEKFPLYKECIFALSIKLSNSKVLKEKRLNYKAIRAIKENAKISFYKFVLDKKMIKEKRAKKEINEILSNVKNEVFCMGLGENKKEIQKNALKVAKFCIKNGYNYTDRIHIRLWSDKSGV
ncbi:MULTISPECIES: 7-carboxy-7-deazaguanine synthase QueE [unclassified Campylobacter]|uniref:7-carboxy-7-deazaguanine synthase QueE n=1 Tax=unclassified Campylobacter TaxID=2593542 RepID=UPI001237A6D8|nr:MULTISPECIES: 7-carboxy-7-deazaguanine synthase QueE [unclassified Campylobacter]KAA6225225.1 7-carboxy-7-deazaguanine synthase QueE [Campylobacter sp. LR196d]KAA6226236.1 7-carboxy-7-deazaguanine synthase QueE [Campylobacter sp. LR185c]KAA6228963.1 7-carboxy-7-deazaguanine synthase QueE [Campylobacter sp. LR286c]KAA6231438.1 7-carboxy-7-deazaguanine synthase QueE [Campylobacter sp. LR264d]KAA6231650.1 7-carboxy-7-deazaguanine synthase QueE [Campylobacter sp. LR291e]